MSLVDKITKKEHPLIEAYYRHVSNIHVMQIEEKLDAKKDEIKNMKVPNSLDEFVMAYSKKKTKSIKRKKRTEFLHKVALRAAIFIVFISLTLTTLTLTVEAVRVKLVETIMHFGDGVVEIQDDRYNDDMVNIPDIPWDSFYYPKYLPDGFSMNYFEEYGTIKMISFASSNDEIRFMVSESGTNFRIPADKKSVIEVDVQGYAGFVIKKENSNIVLWFDDMNSFQIESSLEEEELLKIANSMVYRNSGQ